jgi:murein DD-endopeptidase MepM/ murein hydrolase activator NlpD
VIWYSGVLSEIEVKRFLLLVLACAVMAGSISVLGPVMERAWFVYTLAADEVPAHLPNPVASLRLPRMTNSWGADRPGGRKHEGIDVFAPKGTPVVSTTRGIVTRVGSTRLGGRVVGVLGPGLEWHYYAHLDRFGAFGKGDIVEAGDVLGYVGNTGNARGTPPHLHYGIYRNGAENPYPRLTAAPVPLSDHPLNTR